MHSLLSKILGKRGINNIDQLDKEEQSTFEGWQAILSKEELNLEDVKNFCRSQIDVIEGKWRDLTLEQSKKAEMIPYHTVYKTLLGAISSPQVAREALEKNLIQLLQ